jgi:hypothetical protein
MKRLLPSPWLSLGLFGGWLLLTAAQHRPDAAGPGAGVAGAAAAGAAAPAAAHPLPAHCWRG